MRNLSTSIDISAAPEIVWKILLNFGAYSAWNPFIVKISGPAHAGARLSVTVRPGETKSSEFKFSPKCLKCDPYRELRWRGSLGCFGMLMDGDHFFQIIRTETGCRLTHGEEFSGGLVPLYFLLQSEESLVASFASMNKALKQRAEAEADAEAFLTHAQASPEAEQWGELTIRV